MYLNTNLGKVVGISVLLLFFFNSLSSAQNIDIDTTNTYTVSEALADGNEDGGIDNLDSTLIITGRASSDNLVYNDRLLSVYLQDDSAGIQIYSGTLVADIRKGDSLVVKGKLQLYYDKPEILVDTLFIVDTEPKVPQPKPLKKVAANPEQYLGMLVKGKAIISQKSASSGYRGFTISVEDSVEHILEVYISQAHTYKDVFEFELLSIGDEVEVTGVIGKFMFQNSGTTVYHVMPRTPDDIRNTGFPMKYVTYLMWIGLITLLFIFGWIIVLRKQVKARTQELSTALEEKEILMQEIHHRVKNNLAKISGLLDLQISTADHPAVEKSLSNSKSRINSMALIHDKLYQTQRYSIVRLDNYLKDLVTAIHRTYTDDENEVKLRFDLEPVELSVDKTVVCGLLVNELVVNAYKYAFEDSENGNLSVLLKNEEEKILLSIADNGPGLPSDFENIKSEGLGTMLVQNFADQLDAEMQINSDDSGTEFIFSFSDVN